MDAKDVKALQKEYKKLAKDILANLKDNLGFTIGDQLWYYELYNGKPYGGTYPNLGTIQRIGFSSAGINITFREVEHNKTFMFGHRAFLTKELCEQKIEYEKSLHQS